MGTIRLKRFLVLSACIFLLALVILFARGPLVSNLLKSVLLPELSAATGRQVLAERMAVNIFPLFVDVRELRVFDNGREVLLIPRVKGYVSLLGLLKKEIALRRLAIRSPSLVSDEAQLQDIAARVRHYLAIEREGAPKVTLRNLVVEDGAFTIESRDRVFTVSGLSGDVLLPPVQKAGAAPSTPPRITFGVKQLSVQLKGWPELKGEVKGVIAVRNDTVEVKGIQIGLYDSMVHISGEYSDPKGSFQVRVGFLMESLRRIFGLKRPGEGEISAKGTVLLDTADLGASLVDLKLKGDVFIQTLMELLKVEDRIEGRVSFSGDLQGPLNDLRGTGEANLVKGNLYDIDIDKLACTIEYRNSMLFFTEGRASLYNGHGEAAASLSVSESDFFSVAVKVWDVDSPPLLKLIGWDPGFPLGKVKGELRSAGELFEPSGWFEYASVREGGDFPGRVRQAKGGFRVVGDVVTLLDTEAKTARSTVAIRGDVDMAASTLSLTAAVKTESIRDVTGPYLSELEGSGAVSGTVGGTFGDPQLRVTLQAQGVTYNGYPLGDVLGDIDYRKELAEIREVSSVNRAHQGESTTATVRGTIRFPSAKALFDLGEPLYALSLAVRNGDAGSLSRLLLEKRIEEHPEGSVSADVRIAGKHPEPVYQGSVKISGLSLKGVGVDSAAASFSYDRTFVVKDFIARKGGSVVTGEGTLSQDNAFSVRVSSKELFLKDMNLPLKSVDARLALTLEGRGTLEDPSVQLDATVREASYRGTELGPGKIKAVLKGRTVSVDAALFSDKVTVGGSADVRDRMPWTAHAELRSGRYDFLLKALLKEAPEDLLLNLRGSVDLSGDSRHVSARATITQTTIALFGISLSNDSEIRFATQDRKVLFDPFSMRSGAISLKVSGNMEVGKEYDLVLEGKSGLAPLKLLSKKIDTIRGDASYVLAVSGKWRDPKISGGMQVSEGVLSLRDTSYRVSAVNGYFYFDQDKVVVEKLQAKAGGGTVEMSGVAYFQELRFRKLYLDTTMTNMGFSPTRDFFVSFGGKLLVKGTPEALSVTGDVGINRARYRERVEWTKWLLKAKVAEKPRGEVDFTERTTLNIRVQGSENVLIDNNVARAPLKVDLVLRGTMATPVIFGRVESREGAVYFRNNEFKIIRASADFSDPRKINPVVDIAAETAIKGYTIRINLEGQLDQFNLSLVSTPYLESEDILALLTVGRFARDIKGPGQGIGAGEATAFLAGEIQDVMEERLRSITGFDRIVIEPYATKATGEVNPSVTVSKTVGADKVHVTLASPAGALGGNVLKVEYDLKRNATLTGLVDEQGSIGGGIKFRFEFK